MKERVKKWLNFVWKHKILFLILIIPVILFGYFGYKKNIDKEVSNSFQTVEVTKGDISVSVTGGGQIYARKQVDLQGVAAGEGIEVVSVNVKNDQEVEEGDLIVVLDTTEAYKKVRDAELNLQAALINQKQTNREFDNETVEEKWQRQTQDISVQQKRNSLADARKDLEDYYIRAPFDGVVTGLSVNAGDSVSRDDIIASVITKELYAKISLNEVDVAKVEVGNEALLSFDALSGETMQGKVEKVDTIGTVSQNVVVYNAEISFNSTSDLLKPGMSVGVEIIIDSKTNVLLISNSALKNDKKGTYVQVVGSKKTSAEDNSRQVAITKKYIETGITNDINTEVVSGLSDGEVVVVKTGGKVSDIENSSGGLFRIFGGGPGGGRVR
jgi:RND family efflux transporter MFP subunit